MQEQSNAKAFWQTRGERAHMAAFLQMRNVAGAHHTLCCYPSAEISNVRHPGHAVLSSRTLRWSPFAELRLPEILGRKASPSRLFPVVASVQDGSIPASTSPSLQPAYSYPTPVTAPTKSLSSIQQAEEFIEKSIFNCRFFTLMGVVGSLTGSVLCFFKGCTFVVESFREYFYTCLRGVGSGKVILLLVEAVDVYLMGTVMLIFGMGLYELFVSALDVPGGNCFASGKRTTVCGSNLFGLFQLKERPKWLEIRSLDELKTKLGHVIVMILLVGMFEKSKKVPIHTGTDLLCFSASILLASGCLYFLSKLHLS